jgi:hypothetical protein
MERIGLLYTMLPHEPKNAFVTIHHDVIKHLSQEAIRGWPVYHGSIQGCAEIKCCALQAGTNSDGTRLKFSQLYLCGFLLGLKRPQSRPERRRGQVKKLVRHGFNLLLPTRNLLSQF